MSMKSIKILSVTAGLALALPNLAAAETVEEQIIRQLQAQGFNRIEVQRTLLGRVRIDATSSTLERELIFNPGTGEILRDYWEPLDDRDDESTPSLRNPSTSNSGGGSRRDDDEDGGTNAGSGSLNSGSGNSGSQDDEDDQDDDDKNDDDEEDEEDDQDDDDEDDDDDDDDDEDDDDDDDDDEN